MKTKLALLALALLLPMLAFAQQTEQPEQPADTADTADTEEALPIPEDLPACMAALDSMLGDKDKAWLREHDAVEAHFGLGMWLRNNWGLWGGDSCPLPAYFRAHGIHHPDDMSGLILDCYVQHLNGEDVDYERMLGEARRVEEEWFQEMGKWVERGETTESENSTPDSPESGTPAPLPLHSRPN